MNMGVFNCGHLWNVILVLFCMQNENENKVRGKNSMICYETTSIILLEEQHLLTYLSTLLYMLHFSAHVLEAQ